MLLVIAILLIMSLLAVAGPLLEDIIEWLRPASHRRGHMVRPPEDRGETHHGAGR